MQDPSPSVTIEQARRLRAVRHARRGVVAGYLHSLSDRHASVRREQQPPVNTKTSGAQAQRV
jgi:hypothetical protein